MNGSHIKYRLGLGSPLLRRSFWETTDRRQLHILIMRFAQKQHLLSGKAKPSFIWRRRRLEAVAVFERRFGPVPAVFRAATLPRKLSLYSTEGRHIWPFAAQPALQAGSHAA
ncbi:hypothetical protein Hneap_0686 [Halothiobacillus neapolitanus c2]|uniref:Uncharacterized protein n=1 Tax=Halothiobacillus neapolitanus (strain ATCC 23641 / DSM 15147 / CIP 104769 / NCIMB 8539 / c2) TaxID=555778 RepID=D0KYL4_HALNC|nr:hypothetical protein Hneap_0686 [Halothiobacillus neapolitanus c2]TDN65835.1 hypothetical protein C8D83_101148 [Halothiobacillus neapolitanus]